MVLPRAPQGQNEREANSPSWFNTAECEQVTPACNALGRRHSGGRAGYSRGRGRGKGRGGGGGGPGHSCPPWHAEAEARAAWAHPMQGAPTPPFTRANRPPRTPRSPGQTDPLAPRVHPGKPSPPSARSRPTWSSSRARRARPSCRGASESSRRTRSRSCPYRTHPPYRRGRQSLSPTPTCPPPHPPTLSPTAPPTVARAPPAVPAPPCVAHGALTPRRRRIMDRSTLCKRSTLCN